MLSENQVLENGGGWRRRGASEWTSSASSAARSSWGTASSRCAPWRGGGDRLSVATDDPEQDLTHAPRQILWENLVKESGFLTEEEFWVHHDPDGRSYVTDATPPVCFQYRYTFIG